MSFTTSQSTAKIDAALTKAQAAFTTASKDKLNPHFKSKYADLGSVFDACKAALMKNDISITQWLVHADDARLHMVTRLGHAGEWMMAESSIPVSKQDAQGYGSSTTYLRRFALAAALGIVADEDDDGNGAIGRQPPPPPPPRTPNVERDRHFGNAADEIRSGQNGTPGKPANAPTNDPKAWANSDLAVEFLRGARADLSTITHGSDFSRWMQDFRWEHDAVIAFGSMVGKDGRTRAQYLNDLIAETQQRCRPADGLRGAA